MDIYAAHIRDDGKIQSVKDHLEGTAKLASNFAVCFGGDEHAYLCGLLHDAGKYSEKFQRRIHEGGNMVDHSTAGTQFIKNNLPTIGFLLAYCIAGHHGGLPDGGSRADTCDDPTLNGRIQKKIEVYSTFEQEVDIEPYLPKCPIRIRPLSDTGFSVSFYIRMLFSSLVDADFLDTEKFMSGGVDRIIGESIDILNLKLDEYIKKFDSPTTDINIKRAEILNFCIQKASQDKGLYTLTVPTGGGKTISSLAFALKHAKTHNMDRIIYVIPYNSIIEQNAAVFKNILGEDNVLEHHSDFTYDETEENQKNIILAKQKLATENWDMPVIVTTNVQFFESLFANKTSKSRKLHNIANSVIIFDEAQMLPTQFLKPCVQTLAELVHNYGSTAVLCSATQPTLGRLFPKEIHSSEICENISELFDFFKRTEIIPIGELDDDALAKRLNSEKQVLCIVNTRQQAQNLFKLLDEKYSYHLSTLMYPIHRKRILQEIRARLTDDLPCRVVSTSLIEAGVDIDFPVVYRAEAGLDSEIQAAGRCNRENMRSISPVYIFKPSMDEYLRSIPSSLKRPLEIAHSIIHQFTDIASPEAISDYFSQLYLAEGDGLDMNHIVSSFEDGFKNGFSFPFGEAASQFKLIDNSTRAIVIPDDDIAKEFVQRLKNGERSRQILRQIQQYTVNVYDRNYDALYGAGYIEPLDQEISVLVDMDKYSEKSGLTLDADNGMGIFVGSPK